MFYDKKKTLADNFLFNTIVGPGSEGSETRASTFSKIYFLCHAVGFRSKLRMDSYDIFFFSYRHGSAFSYTNTFHSGGTIA